MALPIIEEPIYGQMTLETAAWASTFTWVDRTNDIVDGINYSEGGRVSAPGTSQVDVGTLVTTFKNVATAPLVGDLVRLRRTGTTEYVFTGYVQDVSQRVVFDNSVSYTTPVTLTTIVCADWVGYVSQFQLEGIGGASPISGNLITSAVYYWEDRIAAIHKAIDATYATKIIGYTYTSVSTPFSDTDMVGTISNHLDLMAATEAVYWYGAHVLPTNKTTGRTGLVYVRNISAPPSSGKTFTDIAGTAGQLHYVELDQESSSANVANNIVASNRSLARITDPVITRIGGFNEENYMVINGVNTPGIPFDANWKESDATSITTYGNRQAEISTNVGFQFALPNLIINPSAEYTAIGWSGGATNRVRRRRPSEDTNPFTAYSGDWALRSRTITAQPLHGINFEGGEDDGIPVRGSRSYRVRAWCARGTVSRTDVRARVDVNWFDENDATISTTTGTNVTLTTANTWYRTPDTVYSSPANAVRATVNIIYTRTGGGNHTVNDRLWADAIYFGEGVLDYFDGDTPWTTSHIYTWSGGVGESPSLRASNQLDDSLVATLARYSTTGIEITRIRWNVQEDITAVASIYVGSTIQVRFKGTTTTHRVVGIDGNISPDRYMIDYYLEKV